MGLWYTDVAAYASRPMGEQLPPPPAYTQPMAPVAGEPAAPTVDPFGSNESDDLPF